jgi:hypothetical protein
MNNTTARRVTGVSGVLVGAIGVSIVPLYFMYSAAPPAWNVLTRNLLNVVLCACLIVFLAGLRHLIREADPAWEWVATLIYGAGLVHVSLSLVGASLETGGVFSTPDGTIDPTTQGPLAYGNFLLHGTIGRVLTALFLFAAGAAVLRTKALPRWVAWSGFGIAAWNLAFVPAMFFGSEAARFYTANGWGNTALTASLILYWVFAVGVAALRRPQVTATPGAVAQQDVLSSTTVG